MAHTFSAEFIRPDLESVRRVQSCCRQLAERWELLERDFARELERVDPVSGPRLVADGGAHEILVSVVEAATTVDPSTAERRWEALGARARFGGYAEGNFVWVGHALVRAVRDLLPDSWSSAMSSSWMAVHAWMARSMEAGAATVDASAVRVPSPSAPTAPTAPAAPTAPTERIDTRPAPSAAGVGAGAPAQAPWNEVVSPTAGDGPHGGPDDADGAAGDGEQSWGYDDLVALMEQGGRGRTGRKRRR